MLPGALRREMLEGRDGRTAPQAHSRREGLAAGMLFHFHSLELLYSGNLVMNDFIYVSLGRRSFECSTEAKLSYHIKKKKQENLQRDKAT